MTSNSRTRKYIVGLTGGIGSGKSTVAEIFAGLGVDVVDADAISRQLVVKGSPALRNIVRHFGESVLTPDGELDRAALRSRVFNNPGEKQWLEDLLHPLVRDEVDRQVKAAESPYVLLVVPLLLESGQYDYVNRVLVVDVPVATQAARTARRDDTEPEEIEKIIAAQMPREERLEQADDIIENTGSLQQLSREVENLHEHYKRQSALWHQTG